MAHPISLRSVFLALATLICVVFSAPSVRADSDAGEPPSEEPRAFGLSQRTAEKLGRARLLNPSARLGRAIVHASHVVNGSPSGNISPRVEHVGERGGRV